jgi:S1-C subfamily serine protease
LYETSTGTGGRRIAAVAILLILAAGAGAAASYYVVAPKGASAATETVTETSTTTVGSGGNGSPSSSGTSTAGSGGTSPIAINADKIYLSSNESVVTLEGFLTSTVSGFFFGSTSVLQEVLGSGFVMTYKGSDYIVTNFHVVDGASNLTVTFWNGDAFPASVVGTDPYSDLAIVKVSSAPASEFQPLSLSPSSAVRVGDPVAAIGNPFGLTGSLTVGVVSQLGRTITEATAGNFSIADILQFSAPINPGNSGGPLFNANGQVIGLTTATVNGSVGVGFAIPSDTVAREIGSLVVNGSYNQHPYLGIGTNDMFYQLAQANGNNVTYGVLVENVIAGGPAADAGIKAGTKDATVEGQSFLVGGDVIVSINGTRIINHDALASYLEEHAQVGHVLQIGVMRGTTYMTFNVTPTARPPPSTPSGAA